MVPKINASLGWTLNFAHPAAYIALIALLVVIIVSALL
jgi:uncharacterized membrane protein